MKKQTVILFLLLGLSHTAFAQRVIENPAYEFKSTGINTITQIERNKENTRVQVHWRIYPPLVDFFRQYFLHQRCGYRKEIFSYRNRRNRVR